MISFRSIRNKLKIYFLISRKKKKQRYQAKKGKINSSFFSFFYSFLIELPYKFMPTFTVEKLKENFIFRFISIYFKKLKESRIIKFFSYTVEKVIDKLLLVKNFQESIFEFIALNYLKLSIKFHQCNRKKDREYQNEKVSKNQNESKEEKNNEINQNSDSEKESSERKDYHHCSGEEHNHSFSEKEHKHNPLKEPTKFEIYEDFKNFPLEQFFHTLLFFNDEMQSKVECSDEEVSRYKENINRITLAYHYLKRKAQSICDKMGINKNKKNI